MNYSKYIIYIYIYTCFILYKYYIIYHIYIIYILYIINTIQMGASDHGRALRPGGHWFLSMVTRLVSMSPSDVDVL